MSAALVKAQQASSVLLHDLATLAQKAQKAQSEADALRAQQADNGAATAAAAAAVAASDAEVGARERDLRAAVELQQRQLADAQSDSRSAREDVASLLKSREATLEEQQTRMRELERSLLETREAHARAHASHSTEGVLAAMSRSLNDVRETVNETDRLLTAREAQLATVKREAAVASAQSRDAAAQVDALRADVEQNMGAALQSARTEKWQAACALATCASQCGTLETTVTALQTELADTKAQLAAALDEKKDAAQHAAQLADLLRCSTESGALLQRELSRVLAVVEPGKRKREHDDGAA
jgi:chromosome segregation ATPase